jgi:hypothetical protein
MPHWIAWPLMLLGIWYLPLPLGGYYWSAYLLGIALAVACGIWARRTFRVNVVEQDDQGTLIRIERRRPKPKGRTRKVRRLAMIAVVMLFAATALLNQLVVKPRAGTTRERGASPTLNDWGLLPSIEGPSGENRVESKLSRVAALISGHETEVRCWSVQDWRERKQEWGDWNGRQLSDWGAYTTPWRASLPYPYIQLSPSICASVGRLVYEDVPAQKDPWPEGLAWSVAALAHESQHVGGIYDRRWPSAMAYRRSLRRLLHSVEPARRAATSLRSTGERRT